MLRISKLADYGTIIIYFIAELGSPVSAAQVARATDINLPTVRKVMKMLLSARLLDSMRGVSGGYILASPPEEISLADVIEAIDGPIAITDCAGHVKSCEHADRCTARPHWLRVSDVIKTALSTKRLKDVNA